MNAWLTPTRKYEEISDTLHITFMPGESGTGIELNENILPRIDTGARSAVGLSLCDYSILAQRTETGPRSFPLTGLAVLSEEVREMALRILEPEIVPFRAA